MTFKASNKVPSIAYQEAKNAALALKNFCQSQVAAMNANIDGREVIAIGTNMSVYKTRLNEAKATPGIAQFAKDQENDPAYDVVAEFNSMVAALDAAVVVIVAVNTNLLIQGWSPTAAIQYNSFTPAQTANLKAALQTVADSVI